MSKITRVVICFAVPFVVGLGLSLFGVPRTVIAPVVGVIVLIIWVYGVNNRPVTNVSSANRDQMLAQGNYGLVYVQIIFNPKTAANLSPLRPQSA